MTSKNNFIWFNIVNNDLFCDGKYFYIGLILSRLVAMFRKQIQITAQEHLVILGMSISTQLMLMFSTRLLIPDFVASAGGPSSDTCAGNGCRLFFVGFIWL